MPKKASPKATASQTREGMGISSVLNIHHEGPVKRPTETRNQDLEGITSEDLKKGAKTTEIDFNNPGFLEQGEGKR